MNSFFAKVVKSGSGVFTSRILGLARDVVIAAFFGASKFTDAFFMAYAIPNLFRALFAEGALSSAFVPILSEKMHKDLTQANKYLTDLMFVLSFFTLSIVLIFTVFSNIGILIFIPGYAGDTEVLNAASHMLRIVMPYLFLVSLCGLLSGYLNVLGSYYIPLSSTAVLNLSMIVAVVIGGYYGGNIYCLAWGVFVGGFLQLFYIIIFAYIKGFRFRKKKKIDKMVMKTFRLIIPSIGGVGINQLNFTIGRIIASFLTQGSISYLYYASRLFQFPLGVFSIALSTVSLSEISNSYSRNDKENVSLLIDKSVLAILVIIIPATIGLFLLSSEIVRLVFEYNSFSAEDTLATASALKMYTIGLICYSFVNLFTKVYHSVKDTLTPVKYAFISFLLNIGLNLIFINFVGHAGIALASSISAGVNGVLLYRGISYYSFDLKKYFSFILKIVIAACGMMLVLLLLKNLNIHVLVNIIVCAVIYFMLLYMFKIRLSEVLK